MSKSKYSEKKNSPVPLWTTTFPTLTGRESNTGLGCKGARTHTSLTSESGWARIPMSQTRPCVECHGVVKYIRARLSSHASRGGLASKTGTCIGLRLTTWPMKWYSDIADVLHSVPRISLGQTLWLGRELSFLLSVFCVTVSFLFLETSVRQLLQSYLNCVLVRIARFSKTLVYGKDCQYFKIQILNSGFGQLSLLQSIFQKG
jgi:hypothetical protein